MLYLYTIFYLHYFSKIFSNFLWLIKLSKVADIDINVLGILKSQIKFCFQIYLSYIEVNHMYHNVT
jgi:hypothetical protein